MQKRKNSTSEGHTVSRRSLLKDTAAAAAFTLIPRHVLGGTGG